ncbi:MAG: hypothetical protein LBF40_08435 [Deltaproteobacteria bacterium]|jgi:hypothetical protein|nr:hypothetical protein [Deltaproteobacteria bacterium]
MMPYDDKDRWTPDPEDAIYTDPDESKYLNKDGNDTRFGSQMSNGWLPDPPEILKLKKSGRWAWMRPIHRRWAYIDYIPLSDDMRKALHEISEVSNARMARWKKEDN